MTHRNISLKQRIEIGPYGFKIRFFHESAGSSPARGTIGLLTFDLVDRLNFS